MERIIREIDKIRGLCENCPGHPICVFSGEQNCEDCGYSCERLVCRYCHPKLLSSLKAYCSDGIVVTDLIPCAEVSSIFQYTMLCGYENAIVPYKLSDILEVSLEVNSLKVIDDTFGKPVHKIFSEVRETALAYIDYTLLKRRFDGEASFDFLDICMKLGVKYSRTRLQEITDPAIFANLVNMACDPHITALATVEGTTFQSLQSQTLQMRDDAAGELDESFFECLVNLRDDYKGIFLRQLKDLRSKYSFSSKKQGKASIKTMTKLASYIYYSQLLSADYKMKKSLREFIKEFLDAMGIRHAPDIKVYEFEKEEDIEWLPILKNMRAIIKSDNSPSDNPK